ncbi:MAG: replication endonuclease [Maribacter sp.]|nr:replication endonuclease [Maribacter sp.]
MGHKFDTNDTFAAQEESVADKITKGIGTRECAKFRANIFGKHPDLAIDLARKYSQIAKNYDYIHANLDLLKLESLIQKSDLNLSWDKDQITVFCNNAASSCRKLINTFPTDIAKNYCFAFITKYDIALLPPDDLKISDLNRFMCSKWWYRKISILRKRSLDTVRRNLNIVSSKNQPYVSDYSVHLRKKQKDTNRRYLESNFIQNEQGQSYSLYDIAQRSVSNPEVRRAELMTRISGFEEVATLVGDIGLFITINTPSRMHATIKNTGKPNPKFDGTNPKQAHQYLCHIWTLIRAELHRKGIQPYGFRIVEPHHDGTPHWHLLVFVDPEHKCELSRIVRHYSLLDSPNEKGAKDARVKIVEIDPAKGSAAGYVAKYISKSIDGYGIDEDLDGNNAKSSATRIEAWASLYGIRQFQQIGGPSVSLWRELRRLRQETDEELEPFREAADSGDWAAFVILMGGPTAKRADRKLQLWKEKRESIDIETGEIINRPLTFYGDKASDTLVGIKLADRGIRTRCHVWNTLDSQQNDNPEVYAPYYSHAPP